MSNECGECPQKPYDYNTSNTFKRSSHAVTEIVIGSSKASVTLNGFTASDAICLGEHQPNKTEQNNATIPDTIDDYCMNDFEFFTITSLSSTGFFDEIIGGELGLGLDVPDNGPSIVSTLFAAGFINEQLLAVHIDTGNQSVDESMRSRATIGGIDH